jgi:hypothetical protein
MRCHQKHGHLGLRHWDELQLVLQQVEHSAILMNYLLELGGCEGFDCPY